MRAIITVRELLDTIIEQVAIKTGILLTDYDVKDILTDSEMETWLPIFDDPPDKTIGVRPEFIEDFVRVLRAGIGNLPDASPAIIHSINIMKEIFKSGIDTQPFFDALSKIIDSGKYKILGADAAEEISKMSGLPISVVIKIFSALDEHLDRSILDPFPKVETKYWDGAMPLTKLFKGELIPGDTKEYLDQRFLDYLAANNEKIEKIHWRNFERLCAEFFRRIGYEIELGPGRADGGVDIRIWSDPESRSGPPLLLIQCKRYQNKDLVQVEYIKALWSDVIFEEAKRGLLITTSSVAPGGKKICQARKWPMSIAENKEVKKMTTSLWRYAWRGKGKTKGVGVYPIPPIISFE